MKLLFDQNISYRIINKIIEKFPQAKHVSNFKLNDREDINIWEFARNENYVIVTFDSDYYDISLINGCPPKIIWLRTGNLSTNDLAALILVNSEMIISFIMHEENLDKACLEIG